MARRDPQLPVLAPLSGQWSAAYGDTVVTAPYRLVRHGRGQGVTDMGKYDALQKLCQCFPQLSGMPYQVLEEL